jgi:putative transposase
MGHDYKRFLLNPEHPSQPVRWAFDHADRLFVRGEQFDFLESDERGCILQHSTKRLPNGDPLTLPLSWYELDKLEQGGAFRFERGGHALDQSRKMLRTGARRMRDLPEGQKKRIKWKSLIIQRFLQMEAQGLATRSDASIRNALSIIQADFAATSMPENKSGGTLAGDEVIALRKMPDSKTFRGWLHKMANVPDSNAIVLMDGRCNSGNFKPRFAPDEIAILFRCARAFLAREKPSIASTNTMMRIAFKEANAERRKQHLPDLRVPSEKKLRDTIDFFTAYEIAAGREGPEVAANAFRSCSGGVPGLVRPLQRVEVDAWNIHLYMLAVGIGLWDYFPETLREIMKPLRMWLTAALCCTTRCYVGLWMSKTVDAISTLKALRMIFTDKTALASSFGAVTPWEYRGTPELLAFDTGAENFNEDVVAALTDLRIPFLFPMVGAPTARGRIERSFRTLDQRLVSNLCGRAMPVTVRKQYEGEARACTTIDQAVKVMLRYIVDGYHNTPHAGLGGQTPRSKWLDASREFGVQRCPDIHEQRLALGVQREAAMQSSGILVLGNWYRSPEQQTLFEKIGNRPVAIRYDRENLGWISLQIDDVCWATVPGPTWMRGINAETWMAARTDLERRFKVEAQMTEPIVLDAIASALEVDREGRRRRGIIDSPASQDDLDAFQARTRHGITWSNDNAAPAVRPAGLFAGTIPVGTAATGALDKQAPERGAPTSAGQDTQPASAKSSYKPPKRAAREMPQKPEKPKPVRSWTKRDTE